MIQYQPPRRTGFAFLAILFVATVLSTVPVAAQASADPLDPIYEWFDVWEGRGYLPQMPVFRPYPQNVIVSALERVVQVGDAESRTVAEDLLERFGTPVNTEFRMIQETRTQNGDLFHAKGAVEAAIRGRISDTVTAAGSITGVILDVEDGELLPYGQRTDWDVTDDWSTIPFPGGRDVAALNQVHSSFAWGTDSLYLHAGIMRRSFGPFHDDGVVWSPYAFQSPGFVAYWDAGDFRFSAGLFSLTATQLYEERTPFNQDSANTDVIAEADFAGAEFVLAPEEYPGKWVFLQDFRWQPRPWLDLAFFESVTWGPRFELAYLLPLKWSFNAQGNVGFADSSKMGLSVAVRPRRDLEIPAVVYVDDASFNDLVRFDFDTKLKLGLQTGAIWTPEHQLLQRVSLDYLALLPYMYTHDSAGGLYEPVPNYTSYTHQGSSIGPGLEPNSDRLQLQATIRPTRRLRATVSGRLIRHANASEGVADLGLAGNDGTITDDGRYYHFVVDGSDIYVETGRLSFQDDLRFMTQDNIETVFQTGLDLAYTVPMPGRARLSLEAGYEFEYVRDPISWEATGDTAPGVKREDTDPTPPDVVVYGVVTGDDEINHYASLRAVLSF